MLRQHIGPKKHRPAPGGAVLSELPLRGDLSQIPDLAQPRCKPQTQAIHGYKCSRCRRRQRCPDTMQASNVLMVSRLPWFLVKRVKITVPIAETCLHSNRSHNVRGQNATISSPALLVADAVYWTYGAPALATGTLPMVRTGTKTTILTAIHGASLKQRVGQV